jgi:predicted secreted protein
MYTVYIRYFWLGNHQIYGVYIRIYTVLANPTHELNKGAFALSRFEFTLCQRCCCTQIVVPLQNGRSTHELNKGTFALSRFNFTLCQCCCCTQIVVPLQDAFSGNNLVWDKKASSEVGAVFERLWDKKASSEVGTVFERLWDKKASSEVGAVFERLWDKKASSEVGAVFERLWDKKASSERKVLCTTGRVWRSAACVCGHNGEKNGWYGLSGGGASG